MDNPEANVLHDFAAFVDRLKILFHQIGESNHFGLFLFKLQFCNRPGWVRFVYNWSSGSGPDPFSLFQTLQGSIDPSVGDLYALADLEGRGGSIEDEFKVSLDLVFC